MSAIKDALKAIGSQLQLSSPVGYLLQKLVLTLDTVLAGITAALAQRFAEVVRATNGVIVPIGTSANIFNLNPSRLTFSTDVVGEKVQVWFSASRANSAAGGFGQYQILLDGVLVGSLFEVGGNVESVVSFSDLFTIATVGVHSLDVRATAVGGNESVGDNATLVAVDYGAI